MKNLLTALCLTFATGIATYAGTGFSGATGGQKTFKVNDAVGKAQIGFDSDAPLEKIKGNATDVAGEFKLDPTNIENTTGRIEVKVASMTTAISKRDDHMRSADWLDAEKYPTIVYDVQRLKDVKMEVRNGRSVATATAVGTFTMHGVTKPLEADVTLTYVPESTETKKRATGDFVSVKANFKVGLKNHQVTGKSGIVGSKVGEEIAVEASVFANS